jgi:hypothetical protein
MDHELFMKLKEVNPNKNEWGINQKMICNIIGIFCPTAKIEITMTEVNRLLSTKQLSSYLRNHAAYGELDCVFNKQQHKKIEEAINKFLSASTQMPDNQ